MKELKKDLKETFAYMANSFMMIAWGLVAVIIGIVSITGTWLYHSADTMLSYPEKKMEEYKKQIL